MSTTYNRELDVNARNWTTEGATPPIPSGYKQHYHSHPDYDGIIFVIGDGSTAFNSLFVYASRNQYISKIMEFDTNNTSMYPNVSGWKQDNDTIRVCVDWGELPYQSASNVLLTLPATAMVVFDSDGLNVTLSGTFTYTNISVGKRFVYFYLVQTGAFTSLSLNSALFFRSAGSGGKFILS